MGKSNEMVIIFKKRKLILVVQFYCENNNAWRKGVHSLCLDFPIVVKE